jgi:hypothetical protein
VLLAEEDRVATARRHSPGHAAYPVRSDGLTQAGKRSGHGP